MRVSFLVFNSGSLPPTLGAAVERESLALVLMAKGGRKTSPGPQNKFCWPMTANSQGEKTAKEMRRNIPNCSGAELLKHTPLMINNGRYTPNQLN